MQSIHSSQLKEISNGDPLCILDVREPDEYQGGHIPGAILIPLHSLEKRINEIPKNLKVCVYCKSGNRSQQAIQRLKSLGFNNLFNLTGGIIAYQKSGGQLEVLRSSLPIMQQAQIVAGLLALLSTLLAWLLTPLFLIVTGFIGVGLLFSGITGFCGIAQLLGKMPWNKSLPQCQTPKG